MALLEGFTLDEPRRKLLHEKLGRELPAEVYAQTITGHRILIVPEPVEEKSGLLFKPRSSIEREKLAMGAGWIVSVGAFAGQLDSPYRAVHPGHVIASHPSELLGKRILFKAYSGVSLRLEENEDEFGGSLQILTDREILAISEGV